MVKFKKDIMARPKAEWHTNKRKTTELKKESFKDLKNIREKFENQTFVKGPKNKREEKKDRKNGSNF